MRLAKSSKSYSRKKRGWPALLRIQRLGFQSHGFGQAEHSVGILQRLAGSAFDEVIDGGGDYEVSRAFMHNRMNEAMVAAVRPLGLGRDGERLYKRSPA